MHPSTTAPGPGRRPARAFLAASLGLLLAACGSAAATAAPSSTDGGLTGQVCCVVQAPDGPAEIGGVSTAHNGWDIVLLNWMAPHDAVASQLSALAADRSTDDEVKKLAADIDAVGQPRYLQLVALAAAWGQPTPSTDPADAAGHDHGGGSSDADSAATLAPLSGVDFDRAYLTLMIAHHEAALPVAEGAIANGENPQDKELATSIVGETNGYIARMQQILDRL